MISDHGLKSRLTSAKMHLNVMKDYVKPVAKLHYRVGRLYDGSKDFVRVGIKLQVWTAEVGQPFIKSNWHRGWSPFHRPAIDCPGIIRRSWSQSSNGGAHTKETSWHKEKFDRARFHIESETYRKWHQHALTGIHIDRYHLTETDFCSVLLPLMRRGHEPTSMN